MATIHYRNAYLEGKERERFRFLQQVYGLAGRSGGGAVLCSRLADQLGFLRMDAAGLIEDLVQGGYLAYTSRGPSVTITDQGVRYLERLAGRRRSVRFEAGKRAATDAGPLSLLGSLFRRGDVRACLAKQ